MVIFDIPCINFSPVPYQFSFFIHKMLMHDVIALIDLIFNQTEHRAVDPLCTAHGLYPVFIQISFNGCRGISVCCHFIYFSDPHRFGFICDIDSPFVFRISERTLKVLYRNTRFIFSLVHHLCSGASAFAFCLCKCRQYREHQLPFP